MALRGTGRWPSRSTHCARAASPLWNAACALLPAFPRALRRAISGWCRGRCHAQPGEPLLLFGGELFPGGWFALLLQPASEVVAVKEDAGGDVGEPAAWFVGGEVGEDAVVALPVQRPGAVPVGVDRGELLRAYGGPIRVFAGAALPLRPPQPLRPAAKARSAVQPVPRRGPGAPRPLRQPLSLCRSDAFPAAGP